MVHTYQDAFYVSVDCVIFGFSQGELNLLILRRSFEPGLGQWSLPGGFILPQESIDQAAERVLCELTGFSGLYMEQVKAFGEVDRDPGGRVITVAYYALINIEEYDNSLLEKYNACWRNIAELPPLIFDHRSIVEIAHKALRKRAATEPIGFNLLPEKFTLPRFQSLYEAIYGELLDKRNFRKKVLKMNILEKLEEKEKYTSKRGAFYFRFNMDKYNNFINKGYSFTL